MKSMADMFDNNNFIPKKLANSIQLPFSSEVQIPTDPNVCPICHGMGFLRQELPLGHPDFGKPVPCKCRQADVITNRQEELRKVSNLDSLARFTFEKFKADGVGQTDRRRRSLENAYEAAIAFARHPEGWLVLRGGYGCGKTHLAAAIANYVVSQGKPAIFVVVPDLLDHLRATFNPESPVASDQRFEEIRNTPLLVLDDFGSQSSTAWAQEKLFQLFNSRYNAQLPTVITTNLEPESIDARIRSRMWHDGFSRVCPIDTADYRQVGVAPDHSDLSNLSLYNDKTFNTFETRQNDLTGEQARNLRWVFEQAVQYAESPNGWFVLTGIYGCGKTHLAAAIANEHFQRTQAALFVTVPDLLDYLRAAFSPNSNVPYDRRFDEVRKAPFLVLDDLGTESATAWANEKLYQLFNYRYTANRPTVITMADNINLNPRLKSMILRCPTYIMTVSSYTATYSSRAALSHPVKNPPNNYAPYASKKHR